MNRTLKNRYLYLAAIIAICILSGALIFYLQKKPGYAHSNSKHAPYEKIQAVDPVKIGIMPLGLFDTILLRLLKDEIESFYGYKTIVLSSHQLPAFAFYTPRNRYKADSLLVFLNNICPDSINYIMGCTSKDISTSTSMYEDWGIFGLSECPGRTCVISSFRVKPSARDENHFRERMIKIALHELGHMFGINHCINSSQCLMEDACGTIRSVDREKKALCSSCRRNVLAKNAVKLEMR